jgi:hypothetical protein
VSRPTLKIITKEAEGTISELQEQTLFESHFRTSRFSTLAQKLNAAAASIVAMEVAHPQRCARNWANN